MRNALVVAVLLIAAIVAGCAPRQAQTPVAPASPAAPASPEAASPAAPASPGAPASPAAPAAGGEEIKVSMKDNLFEPATITIKAGVEYTFEAKNEGTTVHNMIIQAKDQVGQDFASDIAVNAGQDSKFKVKIDKEGTYAITCTYHPEMKGELKVTK